MVKKYCVIGAVGSFGLHTCMYLIDNTDAEVIGIGRNFKRACILFRYTKKRQI